MADERKIGAVEIDRLFDFLDGLQASGYIIDPRQYLALSDLLMVLIARGDSLEEVPLKTLIAPLICSTPAEQQDFYQRFDRWYPTLLPVKQASLSGDGTVLPLPLKRRWSFPNVNRTAIIWVTVIVAVIALIVWLISTSAATGTQVINSTVSLYGAIFAVFGFMVWLGWRASILYQENQYITRELANQEPVYTKIPVKAYIQDVMPVMQFKPIVSTLRKRTQVPSSEVDVNKTIENALNRSNWLEIVYRQRQVMPEYVVLIDRKSRLDQQARFVQEVLVKLEADGVWLHQYEFSGDPRICFPLDRKDTPLRLKDLQTRHPEARLLIFSGTNELINPLTGLLQDWLENLSYWQERAILTPDKLQKVLLEELQSHDFTVLPMTFDGLASLVRAFETDNAPFLTDGGSGFPAQLTERPTRWTGRDVPPETEVKALVEDVKNYLGENGFYWLCATAVYPELRWELTLFLGNILKNDFGQSLLNPDLLIRLTRLPWFRTGYMPDWIRLALIQSFTTDQETQTRDGLSELLSSAYKGNGFNLAFARDTNNSIRGRTRRFLDALLRNASIESALRDQIFIKFITRNELKRLAVQLPKSLFSNRLPSTLITQLFIDQNTSRNNTIPYILKNLFRLRIVQGETTIYRKSFFALYSRIWIPVIFLLGIISSWLFRLIQGAFSPNLVLFSFSASGLVVDSFILFLPIISLPFWAWFWYQYIYWSNDIILLSSTKIIKVEKKPFGTEERRTVSLEHIIAIEHELEGWRSKLFNFGSISINVGGNKIVFEDVSNPSQVHDEIEECIRSLPKNSLETVDSIYEVEEKKRKYLEAIANASKAITSSAGLDRNQLLNLILEQAVSLTDVSGERAVSGKFHVLDAQTNELELTNVYPPNEYLKLVAKLGGRVSLDRTKTQDRKIGITGRAALTKKSQLVNDVISDFDYIAYSPSTKSELDIPLLDGDRVVGVVNIESDKVNAFDIDDVNALQALADLTIVALRNAETVGQKYLHQQNILIVDNDQDYLQLLKEFLAFDFNVSSANNPKDALKIIQEQKPPIQVVVTEIRLRDNTDPLDVSGLDLIKEIKKLESSTQTIVLTSYPTFESVRKALRESSVFDYVSKNSGVEELRKIVRKAAEQFARETKEKTEREAAEKTAREARAEQAQLERERQPDIPIFNRSKSRSSKDSLRDTQIALWGPSGSGKDWLIRGFAKELEYFNKAYPDFSYELYDDDNSPIIPDPPSITSLGPTLQAEDFNLKFVRRPTTSQPDHAHLISAHTHNIAIHNFRGAYTIAAAIDQTAFEETYLSIMNSNYIMVLLDPTNISSKSLQGGAQSDNSNHVSELSDFVDDNELPEIAMKVGFTEDEYVQIIEYLFRTLEKNSSQKRYIAVCLTKMDKKAIRGNPWDLLRRLFGKNMYDLFQIYRRKFDIEVFSTSAVGFMKNRSSGTLTRYSNEESGQIMEPYNWQPVNTAAPFFWIFENIEKERLKSRSNLLNNYLKDYIEYPTRAS
ncbi:MAG TPA: response regulator [Anaerolineales bacterium]|nr:response regulator [Anaerolineales bacterium]